MIFTIDLHALTGGHRSVVEEHRPILAKTKAENLFKHLARSGRVLLSAARRKGLRNLRFATVGRQGHR
jgi:hypothetical protein